MNKSDYILIAFLGIIIIALFGFLILDKSDVNNALVYYDNDLILKIDLNTKLKEYKVKGYNGDVYIKAGDGKVKVVEEKSPLHLCSKQGYISKSYETIVCLPNKIVIKLESNDDLDVTVG
mgnify:CR=1 FL=1